MFSFRDWYSYLLLFLASKSHVHLNQTYIQAPYTLWTLMYAELLLDCNRATIGSIEILHHRQKSGKR